MLGKTGIDLKERLYRVCISGAIKVSELRDLTKKKLAETRGQGTTEYAILVGVLVVIAIIAVVAFRGKLQELWNSITDGINSL
jgi:Flp pilus assembly pilin Flp